MSATNVEKQIDSSNELQITVIGRETGKEYSTPVWFVREGKTIYLLPVKGSQSEWYKNVVKNKKLTISSGQIKFKSNPRVVTDPKKVAVIADKFRKKYGVSDVKKYYTNFDAGVELSL
jgi:deazaflavin-dependent oxidoreductase (nitroreductase family)